MTTEPSVPTTEVRLGEHADRVVLSSGGRSSDALVIQALTAEGMNDLRRSAAGVVVEVEHLPQLLAASSVPLRWTEEARRWAENRVMVAQQYGTALAEVRAVISGGPSFARSALSDVPGLDALDDHQWVNVAAMTVRGGFGLCVFDEQGAGKTVTTIFAFDALHHRDEADLLLIVAPKSMVPEWPRDFERFRGSLYDVRMLTGTTREKRAVLSGSPEVIVTNFESTVSMEAELRALLGRRAGRAVLVVDESFYVKNSDARRTRAIRRLREWCGRTFVLCGTPAPNSPHDVVEQHNLVDFGSAFRATTIPDDRDEARPVVADVLNRKGLLVRNLKSQVLPDLPGKSFTRLLLPLAPRQQGLYDSLAAGLVKDLEATDDAQFRKEVTSFLARRSALLQVCSNPSGVVEGWTETPAKLAAMDDVLADLVGHQREKVVVWSYYTAAIDALVARYQRYRPVRYDGTVSDVQVRRQAIEQFQTDDSTMLFIGNPAAAGAGITLHRARFALYESFSNQAAHYLQSLDRIHRRGQERQVEYLVLLAEDTLEEVEYERLNAKEQSAQELLGDDVEPPATRTAMLAELRRFQPYSGGGQA